MEGFLTAVTKLSEEVFGLSDVDLSKMSLAELLYYALIGDGAKRPLVMQAEGVALRNG
jgi:hypothetical protein